MKNTLLSCIPLVLLSLVVLPLLALVVPPRLVAVLPQFMLEFIPFRMTADPISSVDGLWIGNLVGSRHFTGMKENNIHHVISVVQDPSLSFHGYFADLCFGPEAEPTLQGVTQELTCSNRFPESFGKTNTLFLNVRDDPNQGILPYLEKTSTWIENALKTGSVLVHCSAGVSRSVTVATAFVMKQFCLNPGEALELVKKSRLQAQPNNGFMDQLEIYWRKSVQPFCNKQPISEETV